MMSSLISHGHPTHVELNVVDGGRGARHPRRHRRPRTDPYLELDESHYHHRVNPEDSQTPNQVWRLLLVTLHGALAASSAAMDDDVLIMDRVLAHRQRARHPIQPQALHYLHQQQRIRHLRSCTSHM
jgi:hypothetical protein